MRSRSAWGRVTSPTTASTAQPPSSHATMPAASSRSRMKTTSSAVIIGSGESGTSRRVAGQPGRHESMGEWSGRVAFITGGSQGIGRAAAELLAAEGASVAVCGLEADVVVATVRDRKSTRLNSSHVEISYAVFCLKKKKKKKEKNKKKQENKNKNKK